MVGPQCQAFESLTNTTFRFVLSATHCSSTSGQVKKTSVVQTSTSENVADAAAATATTATSPRYFSYNTAGLVKVWLPVLGAIPSVGMLPYIAVGLLCVCVKLSGVLCSLCGAFKVPMRCPAAQLDVGRLT